MASLTDSELVALIAGGNQDAFAELVRRYRDAVYGYCYYRVGNFDDARDLTQETFILAYGKLHQLRDTDRLGAWLRKTAANLCTRWSERRREMPVEEVPSPEPVQQSPRAAIVREALSGIPDKERLAVVMHYVDGLSYGEIAGFLETSVTAVKGRLYRGREMLKTEVLKMTQEAFGENKLDEAFVLKSAKLAIDEARKAFDERKAPGAARKNVDAALDALDRLESKSADVVLAKMDAMWWRGNLSRSVEEHNAWMERMHEAGLASDDPKIVAERLRSRTGGLYFERRWAEGDRCLARTRALATELGDANLLADVDSTEALGARDRGDVEAAKRLYRVALEAHRSLLPGKTLWETQALGYHEAAVRALESLPDGLKAEDLGFVDHCSGYIKTRPDGIDLYCNGGGCRWRDGWDNDGLPYLWDCLPPFGLCRPETILPGPPRAGQQWTSDKDVLGAWYRLESRVESTEDTVETALGVFPDCVRATKVLAGSGGESDHFKANLFGRRTTWFAPGIGILKTIYEPEQGQRVTAELSEHHIAGGDGYLPLSAGNWWRYRWVEGEALYGVQTDDYLELTHECEEPDTFGILGYITCIRCPTASRP